MDIGSDNRNEQVEESWVPNTPFKPIPSLPKSQIIYTNSQGYQMEDSPNFCQGAPAFEPWGACSDSGKGSNNWEAVYTTKEGTSQEPWPKQLTNYNFTSLLACVHQAPAALTRNGETYGNSDLLLQTNHLWSDSFMNSSQNVPIPRVPTHDLNLFPGETADSDSHSHRTINQLAPLTPGKIPGAEYGGQLARMQHLCTNETHHQEANDQESENSTAVVETNKQQTDTELQELGKDSSIAGAVVTENGGDIAPCETPQQQKPRRRKHRPRVITENKPRIRKPATPKPTTPAAENQTGRRKYVRKQQLGAHPTTPPTESKENSTGKSSNVRKELLKEMTSDAKEPTGEPTSEQAPKTANHSCRRSLNFDIEGNSGYVPSASKPNSDGGCQPQGKDISGGYQSKVAVDFGRGIEVMVEPACDLSRSIDQMRQKYESWPEKRTPNEPLADRNHPQKRKWNEEHQKSHEERGDHVTADYTHQKTTDIVSYTSSQLQLVKTNAVNWEDRKTMVKEVEVNRVEWRHCPSCQQQDTCSTNVYGMHSSALTAYEAESKMKFSSQKRQASTTSSTSCVTFSKDIARKETIGTSGSKMQFSASIFTQVEGSTRKRSRTPTRPRNMDFLKIAKGEFHSTAVARRQTMSYSVQQIGQFNISQACGGALGAEMSKQLPTKRRTKARGPLLNYESSITNGQSRGKIMLNNRNQFSATLLGTSPEEIWISCIVQKFQQLDINREISNIAYKEQNALVPYGMINEQNALVLYRRDGTVVPFTGAFQPIKKRRPRPKVDLDEETTKVWRLLLENINNQGIDGTDEEKAKWWKEERAVFRGRADSFIARMHLVQGDRRFTQWKGSVVDSVIGVFLTQNVSDHLSSSAFMSLAAHFPLKSTSSEAMRDSAIEKPIVCMPDIEDGINDMSNQSICDQSSMILHDSEHDEGEVAYSNESSMSSAAIIDPTSSAERYYEVEKGSTTDLSKTIDACYVEEKRITSNDTISSQNSVVSSQNSADSPIAQTDDRKELFSDNNTETDQIDGPKHNSLNNSDSFMELLMKAGRSKLHEIPSYGNGTFLSTQNSRPEYNKEQSSFTSESANQTTGENKLSHSAQAASRHTTANDPLWSNIQDDMHLTVQSQDGMVKDLSIVEKSETRIESTELQQNMTLPNMSGKHQDIEESSRVLNIVEKDSKKTTEPDSTERALREIKELAAKRKAKSRRVGDEIRDDVDWTALKREAESNGKREKTPNTMDSLDWEAVRCADVDKVANTIKERGMNNILAGRIKDFLNRLVSEHGSIDLEWLRDVPPDKAKEYLLSIRGLGLKSVECVRLLTLHHLAFPVDTNVGRIAVRLGWVPLQPLPESLQLHLLELYPVLESIQRYLWPRLCKLDQKTLYELHYQMITFGKVFCTKNKPNCNACPMRGECRHFASAFASARLALPGPEEKSIVSATENRRNGPNPAVMVDQLPLPLLPQAIEKSEGNQQLQLSEARREAKNCEPIVEEPSSPEPVCNQVTEIDIEDCFPEDPNEIPTIKLNIEEFTQNLQTYMQNNMELQEAEMSKALVALTEEAASIPVPKLKNISRLRTEHNVYELPDSHPLLQGLDRREPDDPCSYLLAIWTPGETANSIQPPESTCNLQEHGKLCDETTCFSCNSIREANSQIVRGTLLIPCRTAMRGSFPLNGTYFQVNEVFADHDSSLNPIDVPRSWLWNLPRRTVYFGTSVPTIFKGLTTESIQQCFWRGYVCVRGFDQKTRAPRPLIARLHFPASKLKGYERNE